MEKQREEYQKMIREHLGSAYLLSHDKIDAVLPRFLETLRSLMSDIEQLSAAGESESLKRSGHAMKGALLNLGLMELAEKAYSIEKHESGFCNGDECLELVAALKCEVKKIY